MLSFRSFCEKRFADIVPTPQAHKWTPVPVDMIRRAHDEPGRNIDDELFDLIQATYAPIGGYPDFRMPNHLPANHTIWYANDVDGDTEPDAVGWGKDTRFGRKWTGLASDGTPAAKAAAIAELVEKLRTPGNYAELSKAIMHILIVRYNVPCVDDPKLVQMILGKPVTWIGAHPEGLYPHHHGFYRRDIAGELHMKILLGVPRR